ncbi:16S rRNA (cytosine(967)-C(5))-methyltransferase RsmB [Metallumcola ferriviriculae]|uniref:16S rRNA (cytosine(967)-C(5))-methyltransferase n=1 Tax=Metallumcola ferriviriculae TaxID=3039180 RepID=A0AAU0UNH6_9FIRM|nr:16S rRNA (cytosine(967)-C(5))-methyltransferase RsmB [Desulfitibacteraceae bacterium MK1]
MAKEKSPREIAFEVLKRIEHEGAYANLAVNQAVKGAVTKLDRAFITEIVYGTVRRRLTLQWHLEHYLSKPWKKLDPDVRLILLQGAYQLIYMNKVPASAACNEMVNLTKKLRYRSAAGFVNGVLRNVARGKKNLKWPDKSLDPIEYIAVVHSHPRWLVKRWIENFGVEETEKLCTYNNQPSPVTARVNTLKTDYDGLSTALKSESVQVLSSRMIPEALAIVSGPPLDKLRAFKEGLFTLQDESSMLPASVLAPAPGTMVIDGCAAPGGKTTHLAELMENRGRILACDVHNHKLKLIEANKNRLGISIVTEELLDARELGEKYAGQADFLLLDVPCSGLGVLSRRADARWRKLPGDIVKMASLQWEIITGACRALKPGGIMVYSTCTITKEENQWLIDKFVSEFPEFETEDITNLLPFTIKTEDVEDARLGRLQLLPQRHGVDGFFVARLRRKR